MHLGSTAIDFEMQLFVSSIEWSGIAPTKAWVTVRAF